MHITGVLGRFCVFFEILPEKFEKKCKFLPEKFVFTLESDFPKRLLKVVRKIRYFKNF